MSESLVDTLKSQYNKTLDIMSYVIKTFDSSLWINDSDYKYPAWQVIYHALFYGNIYCAPTEKSRKKWNNQRKDCHLFLKSKVIKFTEVYTQEDMSEFLEFFRGNIDIYFENFIPDNDCWPHWYDENQFEFHINNIRHLQHHTAEMIERANSVSTFIYEWK